MSDMIKIRVCTSTSKVGSECSCEVEFEREDFEKCFRDWALKSVGIVFTQDDMISKRGINGNYDSTKHVHDLWTGWKWKASRKENLSEENDMNIEQQRAAFEANEKKRFGYDKDTLVRYPTDEHEYYMPLTQARWEGFQIAIEIDRQGRGEPVAWLCDHPQHYGYMSANLKKHYETGFLSDRPRWFDHYNIPLYAAPQPSAPTIKESLAVAEPVKVPSDADVAKLADRWTVSSDGRGIKAHTNIMGFVHEALSLYGGANHD